MAFNNSIGRPDKPEMYGKDIEPEFDRLVIDFIDFPNSQHYFW